MAWRGLDPPCKWLLSQAWDRSRIDNKALPHLPPRTAQGGGQGIKRVGTGIDEEDMSDILKSPRIKDPILLKLLKFSYDECEITGETSGLHLHHVIFKSHGGDDLRCNIICVADNFHALYHAGEPEMRYLLAQHIDARRPDVACYIAEKLGGAPALIEWFSRHGVAEQFQGMPQWQ